MYGKATTLSTRIPTKLVRLVPLSRSFSCATATVSRGSQHPSQLSLTHQTPHDPQAPLSIRWPLPSLVRCRIPGRAVLRRAWPKSEASLLELALLQTPFCSALPAQQAHPVSGTPRSAEVTCGG